MLKSPSLYILLQKRGKKKSPLNWEDKEETQVFEKSGGLRRFAGLFSGKRQKPTPACAGANKDYKGFYLNWAERFKGAGRKPLSLSKRENHLQGKKGEKIWG